MSSEIHRRLRQATQAEHLRLERRARILERLSTREGRRDVLQGFHSLHSEIESAAEPWLADEAGLDLEARRRSPLLENDLAVLGDRPRAVARNVISAEGPAQALGLLYVLEGSTLGGRVIEARVRMDGGDMKGLSFLNPYGRATGERWRAFLSVAERLAQDAESSAAMLRGAVDGFRHADLRLCAQAANV